MEFVKTMFGGQFGVARSIVGDNLPPVYVYAVETAIQLTLTELNENLREIYIASYTLEDTAEYIYLQTTDELSQIFSENFPAAANVIFMKWKSAHRDLCATIWQENATFIFRSNIS